jgi:hypothetical protein
MVGVDRYGQVGALISERWMAKEVLTVCELCEQLGYRWAVCSACGIEFPYQAADQLAALEAGRMDGEGGWPWFVEGHVPEWLLPSMVWQGSTQPERCSRCDSTGWRLVDD